MRQQESHCLVIQRSETGHDPSLREPFGITRRYCTVFAYFRMAEATGRRQIRGSKVDPDFQGWT